MATKSKLATNFEECRPDCAACCIVISISAPIPGMPNGKKAGQRCIHLSEDLLCQIYDHPDKPEVCTSFRYDKQVCGNNAEEAFSNLKLLEDL